MTKIDHNIFFEEATDNPPFDYQQRLAGANGGTVCRSQLINIPAGLGKIAAVVLAWLWYRVELKNADWPRRLIYCLPMRTLIHDLNVSTGVVLFTFSCPALASINQTKQ